MGKVKSLFLSLSSKRLRSTTNRLFLNSPGAKREICVTNADYARGAYVFVVAHVDVDSRGYELHQSGHGLQISLEFQTQSQTCLQDLISNRGKWTFNYFSSCSSKYYSLTDVF